MTDNWIVFIDTNVLLDFYRMPGENVHRQAQMLIKHRESIITGDQVRMEFLKNRQKVILDAARNLEIKKIQIPAIIADFQGTKTYNRKVQEADRSLSRVREKVGKILKNPSSNDPVFKAFKNIFDFNGPYNLRRPDPLRFRIRRMAQKRFLLGYPPRKNKDLSIGDSLNWEWIIHCAKESPARTGVAIVTRDEDFGIMYDRNFYLNDWLHREFKDRVSRRKEIIVTQKISDALRLLEETVTPEDEEIEEQLISKSSSEDISIREFSKHILVNLDPDVFMRHETQLEE